MPTSDPMVLLAERFREAIRAAFPELDAAGKGEGIDPAIAAAKNPQFGDFQCNAAMVLSKLLGEPPRDVARAIVARLELGELAEPVTEASIAGPGFINIRLRGESLAALLSAMDSLELGVTPAATPETIVVDLLGVNLAKQMHVGHFRSPVIGDALARALSRLGHRVIRQNHVGDWGLNIAMVTSRILRLVEAGRLDPERLTLEDLDRNYVLAQRECQRDMEGLAAARKFGLGPKALAELEEQVAGAEEAFKGARDTLLKLQAKEPRTYAMWERIQRITMSVCLATMRRLHVDVTEKDSAGESSYADELGPMLEDLQSRGVAVVDQGALVVKLDEVDAEGRLGPWARAYGSIREPALVRKTDGGYLYATTDIAAVRRRVRELRAHRVIYAVDARQSLHLRQVFSAAWKAGYTMHPATGSPSRLEHAAFGTILGEDGKPFKTRTGENVNLRMLIDESAERARAAVKARNPDLPEADVERTAEAIAVSAMKYADLSNDRVKDYTFSFDRMLAFEGNTGPYLLYALVRIRQIFARAREQGLVGHAGHTGTGGSDAGAAFTIREPAEKSLALALLRYASALEGVGEALEPHRLCGYLYALAGDFSVFYDQCPVLKAPDEQTRRARLRLCDLTARVLADGLGILGMPTVERM